MKGTFKLFTLVLMAMSVFSCSKDSVKEFEDEINRGAVTITAGINNDAKTKTTLGDTSGESTKVYWEEGDSFILTIGGEDYTFEIDPAYSNENPSTYATFTCADAPETIAAGDYVAKYSNVATPTQQAGTKEGLSDYQYMEAAIDIDTERNLEDVSIKFYTKVSVVELTLTHDDFKGATVSDVALKNAGDVVAQSLQSSSFTGDSDGNIVVYFAVPAGKEFTAATITAMCDDTAYSATINSALTTVEGKLYQVKKSMTRRTVVSSGTCGDSLEWELTYTNDENSLTLTITGTGDMYDYDYISPSTPWSEYTDKITSIELPNGLTSIGDYAFERTALTSIEIPASVTEIGQTPFGYCIELASVTFEAGSQLKTIGSGAFRFTDIASIEIPASVTEIEGGAFLYTDIVSIEIPAAVTEIGVNAFESCYKLASVTFEAGSQLKTIGSGAFSSCSALTSIEIPAAVTEIEFGAFFECESLTSIEIPASVTEIGGYAFYSCSTLTSIEIPAAVTEIGVNAFNGCSSLVTVHCRPVTPPTLEGDVFSFNASGRKIYVPASSVEDYKTAAEWSTYADDIIPTNGTCGANLKWELTYTNDENSLTLTITGTGDMYDYRYNSPLTPWHDYRSNITSVKLPNGLTSIGKYAFYQCEKLASVTFEAGIQLKTIRGNAFESCGSLTSIEIPASVTEIGSSAFCSCVELASVTFEAGTQLKKIEGDAFENSGLTSIEIPASVTEVGIGAFEGCKKLASVTFEAGSQLKIIKEFAFHSCSALTSIEIPATVTEIEKSAFLGCNKLASVTFEAGSQLKTIGYNAFDECKSLTSIKIPESVTVIGSFAFRYTDIASIEIPASVTKIGGYAFYCCTSLVAVHCKPVTPPELGEDVFYTNGTGRKIYVPKSSVGGYKKAANWSTYEDHIIGE